MSLLYCLGGVGRNAFYYFSHSPGVSNLKHATQLESSEIITNLILYLICYYLARFELRDSYRLKTSKITLTQLILARLLQGVQWRRNSGAIAQSINYTKRYLPFARVISLCRICSFLLHFSFLFVPIESSFLCHIDPLVLIQLIAIPCCQYLTEDCSSSLLFSKAARILLNSRSQTKAFNCISVMTVRCRSGRAE